MNDNYMTNGDIKRVQEKIEKAIDMVNEFDKMLENKEKVKKELLTLPPLYVLAT